MSAIEGLAVATPSSPTSSSRSAPPSSPSCSSSSASGRTGSAGSSARSWSCGSPCSPCSACRRSSRDPAILRGLSPHYAVLFVVEHPLIAFVAMGAVVLSITGAEALYADMGHFGAAAHPPRVVPRRLPCPDAQLPRAGRPDPRQTRPRRSNPFFLLAPGWAALPARRARDGRHGHRLAGGDLRRLLGLPPGRASGLPAPAHGAAHLQARSAARSTSRRSTGPLRRRACCCSWCSGSSARLATAYGLAVTGTFLITTTLFLIFARVRVGLGPRWKLAAARVPLGGPGADLLRRQPHQGRPRRLAAAAHRARSSPR